MKTVNSSNNISFNAGLSSKILFEEKLTKPTKVAQKFTNIYGIEAHFQNNTSALANKYCALIFEQILKTLKFNISFPPAIIQYIHSNLIDKTSALNFCIPDTKEVLKDDYPFPGRSIFFGDFTNFQELDSITEDQYQNKQTSSPHFLAPYIHEWIHSLQLDCIFKNFGYGGNCEYMSEIYPSKKSNISGYQIIQNLETKKLSFYENSIIYDILGKYSTLEHNQYLEIFSETYTKFICASLKGIRLIKNPFELIKNTPIEFQKILKKVSIFTQ